MLPPFDEIVSNFDLLDEWEDRYRYLIELGREMPKLPAEAYRDDTKVPGCASQVWLLVTRDGRGPGAVLHLQGDSDAHIVKGLVALLIALLSGRDAASILALDPIAELDRLGLSGHLTPQRSNGLRSMVDRIRREAGAASSA